MAGHSKWANIQHRKGAQDAKRGKLFTKLIREITVAARIGGPEVENNPRLRAAIDKSLGSNMTRDTIDRAVKRGSGATDGDNYDEIRYEGYGPNGLAIIVDCLTDNRNRTVAEVRNAFNKSGGNLGTDGSVAYMFTQQGMIAYPAGTDEDQVMEVALEAGADDVVVNDDGSLDVITQPVDMMEGQEDLAGAGFVPGCGVVRVCGRRRWGSSSSAKVPPTCQSGRRGLLCWLCCRDVGGSWERFRLANDPAQSVWRLTRRNTMRNEPLNLVGAWLIDHVVPIRSVNSRFVRWTRGRAWSLGVRVRPSDGTVR